MVCLYGWRSIFYGRELLKGNVGKVIGNGLIIRVWKDLWILLDIDIRVYGFILEDVMDFIVLDFLILDM